MTTFGTIQNQQQSKTQYIRSTNATTSTSVDILNVNQARTVFAPVAYPLGATGTDATNDYAISNFYIYINLMDKIKVGETLTFNDFNFYISRTPKKLSPQETIPVTFRAAVYKLNSGTPMGNISTYGNSTRLALSDPTMPIPNTGLQNVSFSEDIVLTADPNNHYFIGFSMTYDNTTAVGIELSLATTYFSARSTFFMATAYNGNYMDLSGLTNLPNSNLDNDINVPYYALVKRA